MLQKYEVVHNECVSIFLTVAILVGSYGVVGGGGEESIALST